MRWHEKMDTDKFNIIWDYCYEPIDISLEKIGEDKYSLDIDKLSETCDNYCKDWDKLKEMELDWFTGKHMLWFCLEYLSLDNEPDITVTDPKKAYELLTQLGTNITTGKVKEE